MRKLLLILVLLAFAGTPALAANGGWVKICGEITDAVNKLVKDATIGTPASTASQDYRIPAGMWEIFSQSAKAEVAGILVAYHQCNY